MNLLIASTVVAQRAIDVHSHNILPEFTALLERHDAALEETFPLPAWNIASHLQFMEAAGIETSVLSMPAPQPYFGDTEECRRAIRSYNEACARLKVAYPGKFLFCASLPLPDVDAALREAAYALDTLGADGIKLATNSRGQYVGDSRAALRFVSPVGYSPDESGSSRNTGERLHGTGGLGSQSFASLLRFGGRRHARSRQNPPDYHYARPPALRLGLSLSTGSRADFRFRAAADMDEGRCYA